MVLGRKGSERGGGRSRKKHTRLSVSVKEVPPVAGVTENPGSVCVTLSSMGVLPIQNNK